MKIGVPYKRVFLFTVNVILNVLTKDLNELKSFQTVRKAS